MDTPDRASVLWTVGSLVCTCTSLADGQVQISLVSGSTLLDRQLFLNRHDAVNYAAQKMHTYKAG